MSPGARHPARCDRHGASVDRAREDAQHPLGPTAFYDEPFFVEPMREVKLSHLPSVGV